MWQANITINNNTKYNLTINGVGPGNTTLDPNSSTQWSSEEVHNTKSLLFWVQENVELDVMVVLPGPTPSIVIL